ncbi:DNA translocase FtsK [Treponema saccharophilum]|uniref:DNA translocase FtsK n=1 Tax=Treponema saccharophilum TaxID=165 RepID=UPI003869CCB7
MNALLDKIWQFSRKIKKTTALGTALFTLAAVFLISLLLVAIDFGGNSAAHNNALYRFGRMLSGAYGISSLFIPAFFHVSALQMIGREWKIKNGVILALSIVPFFTLVAMERLCRHFSATSTGTVLGIELFSTILLGTMMVVGEFILIAIFGDIVQERVSEDGVLNFKNYEKGEKIEEQVRSVYLNDVLEEATEIDDKKKSPWRKRAKDEPVTFVDMAIGDKILDFVRNDVKPVYLDEMLEESTKIDDGEPTLDITAPAIPPASEILSTSYETEDENPFAHIFDNPPATEQIDSENEESANDESEIDSENVEAEIDSENEEIENDSANKEIENVETESDSENDEAEINSENDEAEIDSANDEAEIDSANEETESDSENEEAEIDSENVETKSDSEIDEREIASADDEIENDSENAEAEIDSENVETESDSANDESKINFANDEIESDSENEESEIDSADDEGEIDSANEETEIDSENDETKSDSENEESEIDSEKVEAEIDSADDEGDLAEAEIAGELVGGIFSLMDDDAAANPVLKDGDNTDERAAADSAISDREEIEQNEDDKEIERARAERQAAFAEIESAAQKALDEAGKNHEENGARYEFDPTARPVVDSDGNVIEYDDEQESAENEEGDEDFDDLSRAMNHKMNVTDDLDDSDDEDDDENDDAKTDPFRPSTNNAIPESQKFRKGPYSVPTDLLDTYPGNEYWIVDEETRKAGEELKATLSEFKIEAEVTGIRKGPAVTMYELLPAPGVKLSKIVALQDNIALRLAAASIRIVAPIPGKHAVGIEVPNKSRAIVSFKEIIEQNLPAFDKMAIPVVLGKDISGEAQLLDLAKTPHLLIAGSTGAGKSVCVNSMLLSILYKRSPEQVKLVLVDPKIVELKLYNDIPHLLTPVITEPKRALQSLQYCLCEMERRYALLDGMGVRNIISYNKKIVEKHIATEKLPYIVVIIDEFADLMATTGKELETTIARLAAMSRAVGIHLVLATQRPSVDVITGLIKANIPSRIAFMVASKMDSRIIIDQLGADKLLGKGDMLYVGVTDPFPSRIQGTLVGDDEVERVVEFVKTYGEPEYIDEEMFVDEDEDDGGSGESMFDDGSDPLYDQALQIVIQSGKASASYIQRRLKIGYNRAARLVEEMEERGIVGPANGSKPREIIHMPG